MKRGAAPDTPRTLSAIWEAAMHTATISVDVDELVTLFAGEPAEHHQGDNTDVWLTAPWYSVHTAYEVAARVQPLSETALRERFYGAWPVDQIPADAKTAIGLGYQRWRQQRDLDRRNGPRGL